MASLQEYRDEQLDKIKQLKDLGVSLYPATARKDCGLGEIVNNYDHYAGRKLFLAGRLLSIREHGKIVFLDLADFSGRLQLIVRAENLETVNYRLSQLAFKDLALLTRGDFINVEGEVGKSKTGEVSLNVSQLVLLTKVLRPLPLDLDDIETRRRQRYLDLAINGDVRNRYYGRSMFWKHTRDFLDQAGFLEINISVLEHTTGGAEANPFKTHMDALGEDFYLRISHELPLKKLLGGGYEKVYDIGPRFRNEHHSDEHIPEHIAMEFYWAYADWQVGMEFAEDLIRSVVQKTFNTLSFELGEFKFDLSSKWERIDYSQLIKDHFDIDIFNTDLNSVQKLLKDNKIEVKKSDNLSACIDKLFKHIRRTFSGPFWLVNIPTFMSPLAKQDPQNPQLAQRCQLILAGTEVCNAFSELNDPQEQLKRMAEQQDLRQAGNTEAQMLDIDFIEMLEYGMPPAFGLGYSERLFWILEGVVARDGVPFPHLKRKIDANTYDIYADFLK